MNLEKLKGHIPDSVIGQIPELITKYNINTPLRLSHFMAQCSHESSNFTIFAENLNYSSAQRIALIFKHDTDLNHDHIISPNELENAKKYVNNPQALANFVYANQNGNGNEASGDGWRFKGRGAIQTTGRTNYTEFDKDVTEDIIANPDLLLTKYRLLSAGFFWNKHKLNNIADKGNSIKIITSITEVVNGGRIGLSNRILLFNEYYSLLK